MVKKIVFILILILFISCGSSRRMSYSIMESSNIGDHYSKYDDEIGSFDVNYLWNDYIDSLPSGNKYRVVIYKLDIQYDNNPNLFSKSAEVYTYIAYAFEDEKLFFFGLPEDFLKSDNKKANEVGMQLAGIIKLIRD